ncbi:hypothetical protein AL345_09035 [Aeromonas caviae]|uniref:restriction endonuclease subunit S n=1 Tax=Aeromonas TaxID=642 RepID=UPI0006BF297E|nr:restriction endonuclease subunit S [Aeromonas caviae]KOG94391.1 hypothetical protein AL345_09035 [Aeromonas caviae]
MVPKGWIASQVGDIAMFSSGGTPSKQSAHFWGGTEPWISGKDLKTHYLATSIDTLTEDGFKVAKKAPKGSSLILVRGMTLLKDFPVGYATREVAFNQDLKALVPNKDIDGLFLSFLLVAEKNKILQLVSTAGHGTGRLDTESIKSYPVNIPPLSEQNKIAKILSTWDKAISTTEQLLANSQQQKKALMQQLLTGKKRLLDKNGVRFSGEWKKSTLGNLGNTFNGLTGKTKDDFGFGKKYIPYINIFKNSRIDLEALDLVDVKEGESQSLTQFGDIFFTTSSETPDEVGMSSVLLDQVDEVYLNSFCFGFRLFDFKSLLPEFARYLLRSENIRSEIAVLGQGATRYNLSKKQLMKLELLLPNINEQKKIATILSTTDQEIAALQQKLDALKLEKKALMQQLLTGKRRVKIN